jgi:hypothetical protein
VRVEWRPAPPVRLHAPPVFRADCNTPVLGEDGRLLAFPAHFRPIGHSLRRAGAAPFAFPGPPVPVVIVDDPDPGVGKWIESVWRAPDGALYGWYHAERPAPCPRRITTYAVGALVSHDDGARWRHLGVVLEPRPDEIDCAFDNGWFAGGYGDFTVVPDGDGTHFLLHLTSYHAADTAQGIVVARYPTAARDRPAGKLEWWTEGGWRPRHAAPPRPVIRPVRGWRHPDPDAHWGPAVHHNRDIDRWVMLLNRTAGGDRDLVQREIAVSFNRDPVDPAGWSPPRAAGRGRHLVSAGDRARRQRPRGWRGDALLRLRLLAVGNPLPSRPGAGREPGGDPDDHRGRDRRRLRPAPAGRRVRGLIPSPAMSGSRRAIRYCCVRVQYGRSSVPRLLAGLRARDEDLSSIFIRTSLS